MGHKTGTGSQGPINDIGVIWPPEGAPIFVAAYYDGPPTDDFAAGEAVIAEAVRPARWRRSGMADAGMMKDGMARPSGRDMFGWVMRGEVALALGVVGDHRPADPADPGASCWTCCWRISHHQRRC